jgi:hypothetical protein
VIIVEGPDGAGKSTLVDQICKRFDLVRGQRGTSDRSLLYTVTVPDAMNALGRAAAGIGEPPVWDRLFFSEFVYYGLTTGKCQFNEAQRQHYLEVLAALRSPIILCQPPIAECQRNIAKEPPDPKHKKFNDALPDVYLAYVNMLKWMPAHTVVYDYTFEPPDRIFQIVQAYMTRREQRAW